MIRSAAFLLGIGIFLGSVGAAGAPWPASRASAATDDALAAISSVYARNAHLQAYTFDARVYVIMRRFPWFRFHLDGRGIYRRGGPYRIAFYDLPWWAQALHIDHFSMRSLDPRSWTTQYDVLSVRHTGDATLLEMRTRKRSSLSGISATIDPDGVRQLTWSYDNGGYVKLHVTPGTSTYILPAAMNADIVTPRMVATATAEFDHYRLVTATASTPHP
ncbi:MAG: hypothetical protein ACYDG0_05900 [Vulcanimicrobiaceae bacterium]